MEHIILYALSVLAVCSASPRVTLNTEVEKDSNGQPYFQVDQKKLTGEYFMGITISCIYAVPLWITFGVLLWLGKSSGLFNWLNSL